MHMDMTKRFSSKAALYARYRWDYAPAVVERIFATTGVGGGSAVADIGSGTGILTAHFARRVGRIHAVEPSLEMRRMAERDLAHFASFRSVEGLAHATTLPDRSVDLITAAQAVHWFDPEPTRREFERILKPGGWLAILWNAGPEGELGKAIKGIWTPENGCAAPDAPPPGAAVPPGVYFGSGRVEESSFPFSRQETWEEFFGGLGSASSAPDEGSPGFRRFEAAARNVFERFGSGDRIEVRGRTELRLGKP